MKGTLFAELHVLSHSADGVYRVMDEESGYVAAIVDPEDVFDRDSQKQMANQMAAAPELLEALRALVSTIAPGGDGEENACTCESRGWYGEVHDTACPLAYLEQSEAAIAKAEGRDRDINVSSIARHSADL